jgi:hypothetical protein
MPDIRSYDAVIVFTGVQPSQDSEKLDRNDNHLMGYVENVLHNVVLHNPNAILVLTSGSSTFRSVEADRYPAIVQAGPRRRRRQGRRRRPHGRGEPLGQASETSVKMRTDIDVAGDGLTQDYSERWRVGYRYYDLHPSRYGFPFGTGCPTQLRIPGSWH